MAKQLTVELVREYPGRDGYFYADLALPAAAHEIRDALQKTRAADRADAYQDITVVSCPLLPEFVSVRLDSPTLDELNFFAKRLDRLTEHEKLVFRAVGRQMIPQDPEGELVSMRDLINSTYDLEDVIVVAGIRTDEQLGAFVIENDLHDDVASIPENALYLLDKRRLGQLQRGVDNGIFIDDSYVVAGSYERPEIYDGVTLPDEEAEEEYVFRLQVAEAPVNSPDETAGSTQWLTLPADRTEADRLARAHNEDCIEDCVYYGFESAIPQITSEMFGDMLEFDTLNKLAAHIAEMSDMEQVTFKAALTAEKPQGIREALDIAEHLQEYELSYYTNAPAAFFKNYLQHYLDTRFDGRWLDMLPAQKEGEQLLGRLGATDTEYGVISARGHSLYEPVLREEPEAKKLKTQALTDEKLDVIEVLGRRALFCNGRLLPEEIPEGLYAYDLRYSDEKGQFISIEPKVGENHGGTILLRELLDFREQGHLSFTDDTSPNFLGYGLTPREFMETGQAEEAEEQTMEGMQTSQHQDDRHQHPQGVLRLFPDRRRTCAAV